MNFKAYINGAFVDTENRLEIESPLTLKVVGSVPTLSKEDIDAAYAAARNSFKGWRDLSQEERTSYILKFADELEANKDELGKIMNLEIGKNLSEAIVEIERTVTYIKETVEAWDEIKYTSQVIGNKHSSQIRIPLGVVLAISPFNYPVNLSLAKIAPALLAGNSVVFKAATNGSLSGAFIAELFDKISIPAGVFNYVSGRGREIGDTLTTHKEIDMVTFTGSVRVGKGIAEKISMKPMVLELGGNDAAYIRNDANLELAVKETVAGAFGYSGQRCTAIKRVILHKDIAESFIEQLIPLVKEVTTVPLITQGAANYVAELLEDTKTRGEEVLVGGNIEANLIDATVVMSSKESRAWNEEAFGPLLPIVIVNNDEEAIELMNDTEFGLQNSIFTEDANWALEIGVKVESGTLNINAKSSRGPDAFPFSGVKNSGFGIQGITEALKSMTRVINIVNNK